MNPCSRFQTAYNELIGHRNQLADIIQSGLLPKEKIADAEIIKKNIPQAIDNLHEFKVAASILNECMDDMSHYEEGLRQAKTWDLGLLPEAAVDVFLNYMTNPVNKVETIYIDIENEAAAKKLAEVILHPSCRVENIFLQDDANDSLKKILIDAIVASGKEITGII
jgi:hypothetical protein